MIDLRSDTVTKPTQAMLQAMFAAQVGDDVFSEDPTVNLLQMRCAELFGHEDALFCPSGTMANQIAIKAHTQPMDEIILSDTAHIYYYETAAYAFHSGVSVKLIKGDRGIFTADDVLENIQPDFDWLPKTSLVCLENTHNKGGGSCYTLENMQAIRNVCLDKNLKTHIDGARIFNAIIAKGYSALEVGEQCDSISVCFSKGLGAPIGSVLVGSKAFIRKARRIRKAFGGGMRQTGFLAAACLYALDHHIERLKEDHEHAQLLADCLNNLSWVKGVLQPDTNIVIFETDAEKTTVESVLGYLKAHDILATAFGKNQIRLVTHLEINREAIKTVIRTLGDWLIVIRE